MAVAALGVHPPQGSGSTGAEVWLLVRVVAGRAAVAMGIIRKWQ